MNHLEHLDLYKSFDKNILDFIFEQIAKVKIALLGDLSLDIYWIADMTMSELSRETPHFPLPVVEEHFSAGAGGNVARNIIALNPAQLHVISIIGNDWRGKLLSDDFATQGIDTGKIIVCNNVITNAYCKPVRKGYFDIKYEDPRIDFANNCSLPSEAEEMLITKLELIESEIDIVCISDQFKSGCITDRIINKINKLANQGLKVVVDSRYRIDRFRNAILKPNELECYSAIFKNRVFNEISFNEQVETAEALALNTSSKVCLTLGSKGCVYIENSKSIYIPTITVEPPLDTCGAGDTFLAAFSCALASGVTPQEACLFANLAAGVTVKKIGTTGTAGLDEIINSYNSIMGI